MLTPNSLPALAVEINVHHAAACRAHDDYVRHAIAAGERLIEAKRRLDKHGGWLPWLVENVPSLTIHTVQRYMRAAKAARSGKSYTRSFFTAAGLSCSPSQTERRQ